MLLRKLKSHADGDKSSRLEETPSPRPTEEEHMPPLASEVVLEESVSAVSAVSVVSAVPVKEPVREMMREPMPARTPMPTREPVREPVREPMREPAKEMVREPVREPMREPAKEMVREPVKELRVAPGMLESAVPDRDAYLQNIVDTATSLERSSSR